MTDAPTVDELCLLVREAHDRIEDMVIRTPLVRADWLDGQNCDAYLKLESFQHTGSFKVRGALNYLLSNPTAGRQVATASTGNHGAAVAFACRALDLHATVFVPDDASQPKVDAIRALGAKVRMVGVDCVESEAAARAFAAAAGNRYVSPYNDPLVVAGQGSLAVEICDQLDSVATAVVSVGGGGLISGVGAWLRHVYPSVHLVGCSPTNSAVMAASVRSGRIEELKSLPTLSDGTAGGVETDSVTLPLCQALIDEFQLLTEAEIADAMRHLLLRQRVLGEGAAGCAVAGYIRRRADLHGNVVIVVCGGNVSIETLREVLSTPT